MDVLSLVVPTFLVLQIEPGWSSSEFENRLLAACVSNSHSMCSMM